jgi:hypothetical protein
MGCDCCEGSCEKDVRVWFCPKCKSRNVGYAFGLGNLFGVIPKMRCRDCGFEMASFPILVAKQGGLGKVAGRMKKAKKKKIVKKKKVAKKK